MSERHENSVLVEAKDVYERGGVEKTLPLNSSDHALLGEFVQEYGWADLNMRRLLNLFYSIKGDEQSEKVARLNDLDVFIHLEKQVDEFGECDDLATKHSLPEMLAGIVKAINNLKMYRDVRHLFAHWSTRRIMGVDAFVMLTANASDAARRGISNVGANSLGHGIICVSDARYALSNIRGHGDYLANLMPLLTDYRDALKMSSGC
ncbi:hypothetical protein HU735_11555 [Pseudomonas sp. BW16M2]|uniref:hypothetical protein n=1 Tax=Pseudomonas sp. BW16M2 TaxID=2745489 RepID=UPI001648AD8A|nr:hypothetical protein [Pseudomonas sp. BW16M2]MBC3436048.1 hypothetical protein [Pseudomonas sp. BW16M2]